MARSAITARRSNRPSASVTKSRSPSGKPPQAVCSRPPVTSTNQPGARSAVIPPQTVMQDGAITMPYAGRINVIGRTPPQVEKIIVQRLTGKAIEPQALVTVTKDYSNTVTVGGDALKQGARIPLNVRGDRILTVIAEAGGILAASAADLYRTVAAWPARCGCRCRRWVSNPRENIYARPSDTVTVVHYVSSVTAVGATGNNAPLPFNDITMNLEEAVAESGGLVDQRSDPAGVFVLRYEPAEIARLLPGIPPNLADMALVPVAYHINMRDPAAFFAARRFAMRDKDILFVSNSPSTELTQGPADGRPRHITRLFRRVRRNIWRITGKIKPIGPATVGQAPPIPIATIVAACFFAASSSRRWISPMT